MELISLESAEEAQQLADYLRPGKNFGFTQQLNTLLANNKKLRRPFFQVFRHCIVSTNRNLNGLRLWKH